MKDTSGLPPELRLQKVFDPGPKNRVIIGGSSIRIVGRVLDYSFRNTRRWLWFFDM
jgi:hypothetical protein